MTREEAITVLKAFIENPLFSDEHKQAFNIAIHDINQRHDWDINKLMLVPKTKWEQEPCEDAISRQAVLEYIEGSEAELGHSSENELVCRDIKELPPVTPQVKCEDIAKAFQLGTAMGFAEKYDAMDRIIEKLKKTIAMPQESEGEE